MNPASITNPYMNSTFLTDEQKKQRLQAHLAGMQPPPMPAATIAAQQAANALETPWAKAGTLPPPAYGAVPGAPMSPSAIVTAGSGPMGAPNAVPGAPPVAMPTMPGAPPPPPGKPSWANLLVGGMAGAGVGGQTGTGWGMGAGAGMGVGLGALAKWMQDRRTRPRKPFDEAEVAPPALAKGGLIKAKPRPQKPLATVVRMAAGGAAKQRLGYPRTTAPRKLTNPFKGIARGGGKATRGMGFKSS